MKKIDSQSSAPRVSCVIPVYNSAPYLSEAIESILGQTYDDFELIIVNDGSPDASSEIIARHAELDRRIVSIHHDENRGVVYTRNELMQLARGEFIATMDGDDISVRDRFKIQVDFLDANPEYDLLSTAALLIDPDGNPMCVIGRQQTHEEIDAWHMSGKSGSAFVSPTTMMRAAAVRAAGNYREHDGCAEDYDLFLRMAERGKLCTIPEVVLHYRQHFGSLGYKRNRKQREGIRWAVEEAYRRRGLPLPKDVVNQPIPNRTKSYAYRQWSEWSLRGGNAVSARRYGLKAVARAPWSFRGWRALLNACTPKGDAREGARVASQSGNASTERGAA